MSVNAADMETKLKTSTWSKDRTGFLSVLSLEAVSRLIDTSSGVLIVGGSNDDADVLRRVGFSNIVLSNFGGPPSVATQKGHGGQELEIDVEDIKLANDSFELVFAHEVLHHCRSPHKALCEMLRISKKYVMFLEPNDSLLMRLIVALKFSFPYELPAVIHHQGTSGGVRDSQIPNYIYRWNRRDVHKTVSSCIPELCFSLVTHPYWDFNVNEYELSLRRTTRIGQITSFIGPRRFLRLLHGLQNLLNAIPLTERQGNKFFCVIEKGFELRPWLSRENGEIVFVGGQNGSRAAESCDQNQREKPIDISEGKLRSVIDTS